MIPGRPTPQTLFGRKVTVQVDDLIVSDLHVQFKVVKTVRMEPTTLDLAIFNLSPHTRAGMAAKYSKVILNAGYAGQLGQVFSGKSRTTDHEKVAPDVVTRIQGGDGEQQYQFGRVNLSFSPGAQYSDVVAACAKGMGIGLGNLQSALVPPFRKGLTQLTGGYSAHGSASRELDRLLKSLGFEWNIQDGQLQILPMDQASTESIYLLTPDTGLLGSPQHGAPDRMGFTSMTLIAKSLLLPAIRPGRRVQIKTQSINGVYRVQKVTYSGDTAGDEWFNEMELIPVGSSIPIVG